MVEDKMEVLEIINNLKVYRNNLGCNGVTKAVDIFMIDKPDALTTYQSTTQAIITKI